jgi:poly(A) polymerase
VVASLPHRITGATWLQRPETQAVIAALTSRGFAARVVGGAVRNALLGQPVTDVDIATLARPEEVIAAAAKAGLKTVSTGLAHGTVTVVSSGIPYEVTTLRLDVETYGRRAEVAFTDDWEADARRRDFTINALYCAADGEICDPLGGFDDIIARRVRFIGDPAQRIREDYLRILRFFRLTAMFARGAPDAAGLAACVRERDGLAILSGERVRQELLRLLAAPRAAEIVMLMFDYGLLTQILGTAPRPALLTRLAAIESALGLEPDAVLRLAVLAVGIPEDAERLQDRLRLSNEQANVLARVSGRREELDIAGPERAAKAHLYAHGEAAYRQHVLTAWTRSGGLPTSKEWRHRFNLPERWQAPLLPIGGADVIALGVPTGPRVGELLRTLEQWWIAGDFVADETALRARLKELALATGRERQDHSHD